MNILVTGGAGYIGSKLCEKLISEGHKVTVIDSLYYNQEIPHYFESQKIEFIHTDIRDKDLLEYHIQNQDVIIPLACLVGAPLCEQLPNDAKLINQDIIKWICDLSQKEQRIIFPTTNSGYGTKSNEIECDEATPLTPISLYGRTKSNAENIIHNRGNAISLRLATVFGTSYRTRFDLLVNDFVETAYNKSELILFEHHFIRNYIHINDVVECFIFCIKNFDQMNNNIFNVGLNNANLTKLDLANKIRAHLPDTKISLNEFSKDPDKRNYIVSNEKIKSFGFQAQKSLSHGILEVIEYLNSGGKIHRNI
ncbi:NAD(P)-dependent oxidoreductase [Halobacteriovorax sp. HLS]|uniref:NAD-dependent epimerase/dehydratase family protein n=1 Tax=Halobacteriovorax sp. HLS TaxID=2234000 RepID=UPI000FD86117|nr:NAD(P)-dependent oxidoreductase [Halobacteriovorax sp. HLS]